MSSDSDENEARGNRSDDGEEIQQQSMNGIIRRKASQDQSNNLGPASALRHNNESQNHSQSSGHASQRIVRNNRDRLEDERSNHSASDVSSMMSDVSNNFIRNWNNNAGHSQE